MQPEQNNKNLQLKTAINNVLETAAVAEETVEEPARIDLITYVARGVNLTKKHTAEIVAVKESIKLKLHLLNTTLMLARTVNIFEGILERSKDADSTLALTYSKSTGHRIEGRQVSTNLLEVLTDTLEVDWTKPAVYTEDEVHGLLRKINHRIITANVELQSIAYYRGRLLPETVTCHADGGIVAYDETDDLVQILHSDYADSFLDQMLFIGTARHKSVKEGFVWLAVSSNGQYLLSVSSRHLDIATIDDQALAKHQIHVTETDDVIVRYKSHALFMYQPDSDVYTWGTLKLRPDLNLEA